MNFQFRDVENPITIRSPRLKAICNKLDRECSTQDIKEQAEKDIGEVTYAFQRKKLISWNFHYMFLSYIFLLYFVFLYIFNDEYEIFFHNVFWKDRYHLNFTAYNVRFSVCSVCTSVCIYIFVLEYFL